MKKLFLLLFLLSTTVTNSIAQTMYVAAKRGLDIYVDQDTASKILGKIPYGQKVVRPEPADGDVMERPAPDRNGFSSSWKKVQFNNIIGYVNDSYLLPTALPKKNAMSLDDYFNQLSEVAGTAKTHRLGLDFVSSNQERLKTLYKNGMEINESSESIYITKLYILPDFSIQHAFLLLQLLQAYPQLIGEKDAFPLEDKVSSDKSLRVETLEPEGHIYVTEISIMKDYRETKLYQGLVISLLDDQALISFTKARYN